jgi:hypothetical protein
MSISGHETDTMFRRYNITDDRDKLAALEAARRVAAAPASGDVVSLRVSNGVPNPQREASENAGSAR